MGSVLAVIGLLGAVICAFLGLVHALKKTGKAKNLFGFAGIALVVMIVGASTAKPTTPASGSPASTTPPVSTTPSSTEPSKSDSKQQPSYVMTVDKAQVSRGSEFNKAPDGKQFLLVWVTLQNNGKSTISYNQLTDFKVKEPSGNITTTDFSASVQLGSLNAASLSSGELSAGGKVSGAIGFCVASDAKTVELQWLDRSLFGDTIRSTATIKIEP